MKFSHTESSSFDVEHISYALPPGKNVPSNTPCGCPYKKNIVPIISPPRPTPQPPTQHAHLTMYSKVVRCNTGSLSRRIFTLALTSEPSAKPSDAAVHADSGTTGGERLAKRPTSAWDKDETRWNACGYIDIDSGRGEEAKAEADGLKNVSRALVLKGSWLANKPRIA